jgi:branched-chain amino acid transport system substrate-binding protein
MKLTRRNSSLSALASAAATTAPLRPGRAEGAPTVKIGCLTNLSGPYKDPTGPSAVAAADQAAQGFGSHGFTVEVLVTDHPNKPDIARQCFDRGGADLILDVASSGIALAVAGVAEEKNKVDLNSGAATSDWKVKKPPESKGPWDYYKPIASTPTDKAFRPLDKGGCFLVKT